MSSTRLSRADAVNEAGGRAYALSPRHALAQLAATGTLNGVFYATGQDQIDTVLLLRRRPVRCVADPISRPLPARRGIRRDRT